jgi:hypothetical protein
MHGIVYIRQIAAMFISICIPVVVSLESKIDFYHFGKTEAASLRGTRLTPLP